jgi:hypothetical protein
MGRGRVAIWRSAALVLLLAAACCLVIWADRSSRDDAESARPGSSSLAAADSGAPSTKPARHAAGAPARPVAISIPAIGVRSVLGGLGLNDDGTVEVPTDPDLAGWYRLGTRPGALGSAVILGHVDSDEGPAVFYRLRTLNQGDLVDVRLADGSSVRFRVRSIRTIPNEQFPARQVYAAKGGRTLNLITCGGAYDAERGGYQANVVVNARWVRTRQG